MPSIKTYFSDILNQPTMSFRCALIDDGHPIAWRPGLGAKLHYNVCNSNGQILLQLEWIKCHVAPICGLSVAETCGVVKRVLDGSLHKYLVRKSPDNCGLLGLFSSLMPKIIADLLS